MEFQTKPAATATITKAIVIGPALVGCLRRITLRLYEGRRKYQSSSRLFPFIEQSRDFIFELINSHVQLGRAGLRKADSSSRSHHDVARSRLPFPNFWVIATPWRLLRLLQDRPRITRT